MDVLRKLAKSFNDILGSDQGTRHAPADLTKDIHTLMDSLHENEVYHIKKGCTLDDDDGPVKDVITAGLESLCDGTKNPISEYNNIFTRLQTCCKMKPVIPGSLSATRATNISVTHPLPASLDFVTQEPGAPAQMPPSATEAIDDEAHGDVAVASYLDELESSIMQDPETMVMVSTAADVNLDMDEVEVEDETMDDDSEDEEDE